MEKNRFVFGRNVVLVLALSGCAGRPCREPRSPDLDQTRPTTGPVVPVAAADLKAAAESVAALRSTAPRIHIFKPDGGRQCDKIKRGVAADVMERELAGITVYSREKRSDGLMHIQICGSPAGMINVFQIDSGFLKQATERGFKKLED